MYLAGEFRRFGRRRERLRGLFPSMRYRYASYKRFWRGGLPGRTADSGGAVYHLERHPSDGEAAPWRNGTAISSGWRITNTKSWDCPGRPPWRSSICRRRFPKGCFPTAMRGMRVGRTFMRGTWLISAAAGRRALYAAERLGWEVVNCAGTARPPGGGDYRPLNSIDRKDD